jgi:branched-chain amino acid transport system permease protein
MEMPFNVNRRMSTRQLNHTRIRDEIVNNGRTLLLCAITGRAWRLKLDFIKTVLSIPGINVNKGSSYGRTPLLFAIKQNNEEIVKLLLKAPGIEPLMGINPGLRAFIAAVLGGIGNLPGAALGGLLLGIMEIFAGGIPGLSNYRDAIAFAILILILLFKPAGLLGKSSVEKV